MAVRLVVAVTDRDWFDFLQAREPLIEVNFWAPGAAPFKALQSGELFLFKLHAPYNYIVGGGMFTYANAIPCSLAWEAFREANGANSLAEMRQRIIKYWRADPNTRGDFLIGCRILTEPFFFAESDWIAVPQSWSRNSRRAPRARCDPRSSSSGLQSRSEAILDRASVSCASYARVAALTVRGRLANSGNYLLGANAPAREVGQAKCLSGPDVTYLAGSPRAKEHLEISVT